MARRKNTKRIDPRYFLHEKTDKDLDEGKETLSQWEQRSISPEEVKKDVDGVYYVVPEELAMQASALGATSVQQMSNRGPDGQKMFLVRPGSMSSFNR